MTAFATGNQLLREGKLEEAIASYQKAIESNPQFAWSYQNLGETLEKVGRIDEAITAFRQAVAISPESPWSLYKLGVMLGQQGQFQEAVDYLRRAIALKQHVPEFYLGLGSGLVKLGQWSEAVDCINQVVGMLNGKVGTSHGEKVGTFHGTSLRGEAYFYLAEAKSGQQQWSEAVEFYRQSWEINPGKVNCCIGWTKALGKLGRWSEAVELYHQAVVLSGESGEVLFGLGEALQQLGRWDEAVVEYQKAINLGFAGAEVRHHLGYALGKLGRWGEAVVEYRLVVEINPKSAVVRHRLGYALMQLERWREAEIELRKAVELYPGSAEVWQHLGDVLRELGNGDEAESAYRQSLELKSGKSGEGLTGTKLNDFYGRLTGKVSCLRDEKRLGTRFFVVTPCLNAVATIDETIKSVISQSGDFSIQYHVQDGGSTDGTVERLRYWEGVLSAGSSDLQCGGVEFSWVSEPDQGMYDAVMKGFDNFEIAPRELMTWINADDVLMPGALSAICRIVGEHPEVEWIGGPQYVFETDVRHKVLQRGTPTPTGVIREGLCDGKHWEMLQQEGTFFSKALWLKSKHGLKGFELAGDWNFWREMAHHGVYYQYESPLGAFRKRVGQLSVEGIGDYRAEIERVVPLEVRKGRFEELYRDREWGANLIKSDSLSGRTVVEVKSVREVYEKVKGVKESKNVSDVINVHVNDTWKNYKPNLVAKESLESQLPTQNIQKTNNVIAFDEDWQYPAITEKYAFEMAKKYLGAYEYNDSIVYFGFPWATLIDHLVHNKKDRTKAKSLLEQLRSFKESLQKYEKIVTSCQHIRMLTFQNLFFEMGITDIFWSHTVKNQNKLPSYPNISLHPFPLYPVQAVDSEPLKTPKKYLYSYVGSRYLDFYLTDSRQKIVDYLSNDPRGLIILRDQWHYNKIVYDYQIYKKAPTSDSLVDNSKSVEFQQIMKQSVFTLCPSGTGSNSIRLWESISLGSIPVILADTYLPPGNLALWNEATISCPETSEDIKKLPEYLAKINQNNQLLQQKLHALKQLRRMYGLDFFIYDIVKLFIAHIENKVLLDNLSTNHVTEFNNLARGGTL
ncbi:tetratricopeptide repeat protein [Dapis sp. BLCC M172]